MRNKEIINKCFRRLNIYAHNWKYWLITNIEFVYAYSIGVILGRNAKFKGWCSIYRASDSMIVIGNNCSFNRSNFSNHIGINHACVLTTMQKGASIHIGNNVGISGSTITSFDNVTIDDNVRIGANCTIMDGDFHLEDPRVSSPRPIHICKKVWMGANVVVMKGVTIGENSIIGMNSVVTKDIPANVVAAGNPCIVIRPLAQEVINEL